MPTLVALAHKLLIEQVNSKKKRKERNQIRVQIQEKKQKKSNTYQIQTTLKEANLRNSILIISIPTNKSNNLKLKKQKPKIQKHIYKHPNEAFLFMLLPQELAGTSYTSSTP
jgi:hypothetical protein